MIADAIIQAFPGSPLNINGDTRETLTITNREGGPVPTEAEIDAAISDYVPSSPPPDVPNAYSALLLSAVFQRVDALADSSIPIGKAYSKIGMNFAASAGVGWPAVVAPLNASIAELDAKLTTAGEGFTAGEKTWIEDWNATHNLALTLPWGA